MSQAQAAVKNTRTLVGEVVSDKRSKTKNWVVTRLVKKAGLA